MSQIRTFLSTILPSLLAGGLLLGSSPGHADDGRAVGGFWPAASDPVVAMPPAPPAPPSGVSVSIHGGKVQIDGIKELIAQEMAAARKQIAGAKDMPPAVRAKLDQRLARLEAKLDKKLAKLEIGDLDQLGEELGQLGAEVEQEMQGVGEDLGSAGEQWASQLGKQLGKGFTVHAGSGPGGDGSFHWDMGGDDDSDATPPRPPAPPTPPTPPGAHSRTHVMADADDEDDDDDHDVDGDADDDALAELGDLGLSAAQRGEIAKLRADTAQRVAAAQAEVTKLSESLRAQLANPAVTDAEVARAVDAITAKEAEIRKARILAWVAARRALDAGQRGKVERAVPKHGH